MTPVNTSTDLAPRLERCFLFDATEGSYEVTGITGRVPEWLRGSYYVNGPARFERAGQRYKHWLDGDGMICALHFNDDGIRFASRFVQTRKLKDEEQAGRFLYRQFGTAWPGDLLRRNIMLEPPVNVSVYRWRGKLLAFGEQTLPMELDPRTLETIGEFDFDGKLNEVSPFSAHAKLDPASGNLLNFGISFSAKQPMMNVYEFGRAGDLLRRRRFPLQLQHSNHDFSFTSQHVVFFLSPLVMNFERFWSDRVSVMDSLEWKPEKGSRIYVVPRASKTEEPFAVPAGEGYCLHLINCFEADGHLTVDILDLEAPVYPDYQPVPDMFPTAPRCRPTRYVIDLKTRKLLDRKAMAYDLCSDFPAIDNRRQAASYNDFWFLGITKTGGEGRKFFDQLAHGSWKDGAVNDTFEFAPGEYLGGEPVFVGNPKQPDEGVVIVEHLNTATDEAAFLIFDAYAVRKGPIARLPLRQRLHPGFHSSFYLQNR
jgi:all-trans-8'-apo-beta-carotenal 15,15'-oxygenase